MQVGAEQLLFPSFLSAGILGALILWWSCSSSPFGKVMVPAASNTSLLEFLSRIEGFSSRGCWGPGLQQD